MSDDESMGLEHQYAKPNQFGGFPTVERVVGVWREKFEEGILGNMHFREHWRLYVPKVFCSDPSVNCIDNVFDEVNIQNLLFAPLEEFICGGSPKEVFDRISRLDDPPSICGKVFKLSEPTYNCRECGTDPTCVLCVDCFKKSEHRNHRYKMSTSSGGGCCDCGDVEAWKSHPHCKTHILGTLEGTSQEVQFPEDMQERTKITFQAVLQYAYQLLTDDYEISLPPDLQLKQSEDDPSSIPDIPPTFCTVLYNDETHTFENVISTLQKVLKCSKKDAMEFVTNIDREGRAVVKCAPFSQCNEVRTEVERITSRTTPRSLKVQVMHTHVIAHQLYAIKLLTWLQNILMVSKHFRRIFSEVMLRTNKPPPDVCILEGVLLRDVTLWKTARNHWHRLFITGMLKEYEHKKSFAEVFTKNYGSVMKDFIRDDHEHSVSVAALSVQIYTVPTIAHYLIAHRDVLMILLNTFHSECKPYMKDDRLEFQRSEHQSSTAFKRAQFIIYDLHYLLSAVPEQWTTELRKGFSQGFFLFLKLLSAMQGMDAVTRQVGQHMEYEPEWETAFNLHIKLSSVITAMIRWCCTDKLVLIKCYRDTLKKLLENPCPGINDPGVVREIADHSTTCNNYDVSEKPVSIHLPLSRFLAGLHVQLERYGLNFFSSEFMATTKQSPEQIIEPVLRTQVMIAQVQAGLWRRNGYSILHQIYFYHNVRCRKEMLDKDIILLQIGASLVESNDFLIHLLNKFKLIDWCDLNFEQNLKRGEEDTMRQQIILVEEFLALILTIISERYVVGIGKVTERDCAKKEVIQQLCIKPLSHSELSKALPDNDHQDVYIDSIIDEVATFQKPTSGSGKGLYHLKSQYYDQYNVFFYHYTKEELSKSEEAQRKRRKARKLLDCCPPPPLPPLTESFNMLINLLQCDVMFYIIELVLKRACDLSARSFSESQLHRILHLIGYALHEEESGYCEYFVFTERFERRALYMYLEALHKNPRVEAYRDLIKWTMTKYRVVYLFSKQKRRNSDTLKMEVDEKEENETSSTVNEIDADEATNEDNVKKEKERVAKLAAERRLKLMAQMSQAQNSFIKQNAKAYEEASSVDRRCSESSMAWKSAENVDFPVALGHQQTPTVAVDKTYTCILCQEEQTVKIDGPAMVFGAFVQKSAVLINEFTSSDQRTVSADLYYLPIAMSPSPFTSICGHVMHSNCFEKYLNNISTKESRRTYRLRQPVSFDIEKEEFLCPLCESLSNTVLPLLQPLTNIMPTKQPVDQEVSFDSWFKSVILATEKKHQELEMKKSQRQKGGGSKTSDRKLRSSTSNSADEAMDTEIEEKNAFSDEDESGDESSTLKRIELLSRTMLGMDAAILQKTSTPVPGNVEMEVMLLPNDKETGTSSIAPAMSDSVLNMIMKYACSVYTKGLALGAVEDENRLMLYCLKSCSYTIHVVEMLLRNENRSLLGELPTRQKKCIKSLIRLSALQEICKNQRIVNHYAITLLGLLFDKIYSCNDTCILDWDLFGMLVSLVMCLPSLFFLQTPSPFPTGTVFEQHALKLMLVASVAQILIGLDVKMDEMVEEDSEDNKKDDTECLRSYLEALSISNSDRICTKSLWSRIRQHCLPFLRCSCIFFRYLTGVKAPDCLKEVGGDTYENMCQYLGLSSSCGDLLDNDLIIYVFKNWVKNFRCQEQRFGSRIRLKTYLEFKGLITLPEDYSELINSVSSFTCPNSDQEDSRNPTLCLVCGQMLCSQSYCCQREEDGILVSDLSLLPTWYLINIRILEMKKKFLTNIALY